MAPRLHAGLRLGSPVTAGSRLIVPLVRVLTVIHAGGGAADCTPVALLIGERGTWSFVALEEGIGQEILASVTLPPPGDDVPGPG